MAAFGSGRSHHSRITQRTMSKAVDLNPLVCHCLIGTPGSGKSTLAQAWVARSPECQWVSTDAIRETLYGDASIQGSWPEIEAVVLETIRAAIAQHKPVIYDATNAKRAWRIDLMQKLADGSTRWMAWWLKTSVAQCKRYNKARSRQVDPAIITHMRQALKAMPPIPAEGFAAVNSVPLVKEQTAKRSSKQSQGVLQFDWPAIERKVHNLPQSLLQRQRRQGQCQLHPYSSLLSFERLLYLMALLLALPGAGNLSHEAPEQLKDALGKETLPTFESPIEEMSALLAHRYGAIYAEPSAIAQNITWLQSNHLINSAYTNQPITLTDESTFPLSGLHRYSDQDVFRRLMSTIRFIAHHPFLYLSGKGSLHTLVSTMEAQQVIATGYRDSVRRDIGEVLKPYGLMPDTLQRKGYFVGTAILAKSELLRVFEGLAGHVQHLNDPVLLSTYNTFRERLSFLQADLSLSKPIRRVLQQPIVDVQQLPTHTLSLAAPGNAERLEAAIRNGQYLLLKRQRGTGRFGHEPDSTFKVLPLQVVFHNIAWYLGYQQVDDGLLRFERLDRLALFEVTHAAAAPSTQAKALQALMRLYRASYGLHLGNNVGEQHSFLSVEPKVKAQVEVVCELWFSDAMFRFVSEGAQRFPGRQKMSPRLTGATMTREEKKTIFCLKKTRNARFPNRFRVTLPKWVVTSDVDFRRWILGFGGHVKVVAPTNLAKRIREIGQGIVGVYAPEGAQGADD